MINQTNLLARKPWPVVIYGVKDIFEHSMELIINTRDGNYHSALHRTEIFFSISCAYKLTGAMTWQINIQLGGCTERRSCPKVCAIAVLDRSSMNDYAVENNHCHWWKNFTNYRHEIDESHWLSIEFNYSSTGEKSS